MEAAAGPTWYRWPRDLAITLLLWGYYTLGFLLLFAPCYLHARLFAPDVARAFQRLNARFYRWFFALLRFLVPACRWWIDPAVQGIRGSVVVANHLSYLDPILLIAQFPRHCTIAKERLFRIPLYGRMLRLSGYLPASSGGPLAALTLGCLERMPALLAGGGNLVVFPEGTRSRSGRMGPFNPGAFKIARLCNAPIDVVYVENTDRLFRPGRFLFDTGATQTVRVTHLIRLEPPYGEPGLPLQALMDRVRSVLEHRRPVDP